MQSTHSKLPFVTKTRKETKKNKKKNKKKTKKTANALRT